MENSEHRFLAEAPVGKLMRRYAMPCVISLLVGALYNIVDQIFIANASYLGSFGNAASGRGGRRTPRAAREMPLCCP